LILFFYIYLISIIFQDTRLELELKEEKVAALNRELEELTFDGSTEEEIAQLKRSKLDFEKRCKDQLEELDEQAGQIQVKTHLTCFR
jgi:myosin XVIII